MADKSDMEILLDIQNTLWNVVATQLELRDDIKE
jgi:hypothetical protein